MYEFMYEIKKYFNFLKRESSYLNCFSFSDQDAEDYVTSLLIQILNLEQYDISENILKIIFNSSYIFGDKLTAISHQDLGKLGDFYLYKVKQATFNDGEEFSLLCRKAEICYLRSLKLLENDLLGQYKYSRTQMKLKYLKNI